MSRSRSMSENRDPRRAETSPRAVDPGELSETLALSAEALGRGAEHSSSRL